MTSVKQLNDVIEEIDRKNGSLGSINLEELCNVLRGSNPSINQTHFESSGPPVDKTQLKQFVEVLLDPETSFLRTLKASVEELSVSPFPPAL